MLWFLIGCVSSPDLASSAPTLVVSHLDGGEVLAFDGATGALSAVLATPEPEGLTGRAFAPSALWLPTGRMDGPLWATDFVTGAIFAFEAGHLTGTVRGTGGGDGRLEEPCAMAAAGDGRIAVLGNDSGNVVFVDDRLDAAVLGTPVPLQRPHGLAIDGTVAYVGRSPTVSGAPLVQRFDLATGEALGGFGPYPAIEEATALTLHDGVLYVVDYFADRVTAWDPVEGLLLWEAAAGLEGPVDLEIDGAGNLWVLDQAGVVRIDVHDQHRTRVVDAAAFDLGWTRDLLLVAPEEGEGDGP